MSEVVTISANKREGRGKGYCRKLRAKGLIPANLIIKTGSVSLELDPKWLSKAWKAGKQFNLEIDGQAKMVKIQELQLNAVKRQPLHVDLMYI
jgi:ribosomal protein L25 (general stress protein Ctc)